jgi:hypothetical protein
MQFLISSGKMLLSRKLSHLETCKQTKLSVAATVYYWDLTNIMIFKNFKVHIFLLFLFYLPLPTYLYTYSKFNPSLPKIARNM